MKRLTEEDVQKMCKLFDEGLGASAISVRLGIPRSTVLSRLNQEGRKYPPRERKPAVPFKDKVFFSMRSYWRPEHE